MIDYHVHPDYSIDAQGTLEEFCEAALKFGLQEIAFTTHLDTDPFSHDWYVMVEGEKLDIRTDPWLEHYESSIRSMDDEYRKQGLAVKLGVELDVYPSVIENLPKQFFDTEFDLIIGSVHMMDHKAISLQDDALDVFRKYSVEEIGEKYFSILLESIESSLVDILGHLDLYRRFGESFYGEPIHTLWKPHIDELVLKMKKHQVGFEINTSSWRNGQEEPLPSNEFIRALIERGITTITTGSDAHRPEDIGFGIDRVMQLLSNYGIQDSVSFTRRKITTEN